MFCKPRLYIAFLLAMTTIGCGRKSKSHDDSPRQPDPPPPTEDDQTPPDAGVEAKLESIQENLVDRDCKSCHQGASRQNRNVDLTDIAAIIVSSEHAHEPDGARRDLIKPGCPQQSFFLSIMREGKMPPKPASRVDDAKLQAVERWIKSLAPDVICESDEPGGNDGVDDDEPGG